MEQQTQHDAMTGLATSNREGKPAKREQIVYTPQSVINVCLRVWSEGIQCDPCSGPGSIVPAEFTTQTEGLSSPWGERSYVNPPYDSLKAWFAWGSQQPSEQIWLVPVRTHRKWWRAWRDGLDAYCEMNSIKFLGYKSAFPAPVLLGYKGDRVNEFLQAAETLGSVYRGGM